MFGLALGGMQSKTALRTYDQAASQTRRREFETELAKDAGAHPECVKAAVDRVSAGIRAFVDNNADEAGKAVKARCYNDTGSGRMGTLSEASAISNSVAWARACTVMDGAEIPKILGIHNCMANFYTRTNALPSGQKTVYDSTNVRVTPAQGHLYKWFVDDASRGRQRSAGAVATAAPGITTPGPAVNVGDEVRKRGVDEWARVEGSNFVKGVDLRNLVFGAGRSGTTGELLKAYRTFGGMDEGEEFKQYLLAIVIYLVGGGHHTCHEIFSVANLLVGSNGPRGNRPLASVSTLVREAYVPGKYMKHLPESYTHTTHWEALKEKYYDIAMLGHLHGTFV